MVVEIGTQRGSNRSMFSACKYKNNLSLSEAKLLLVAHY